MNDCRYTLEKVKFHHLVFEGTHYEIGEQMAGYIRGDPERMKRYISKPLDPTKYGFDSFESLRSYYEDICPRLTDELQGIADTLDVSLDSMPYWETSMCNPSMNTCSQFAILSSITDDGHSYFGRNYDYDTTRDDRVLFTTRPKGKARHIGFTAFLSGRHDGMNEHGLVASLTGGGISDIPLIYRGVVIWVAIRSVLESCRNVKEALKLLEKIPVGDFDNLVLLDRDNNAAHVEYADGTKSVKQISSTDSDGYIFSVNHYTLPDTIEFNEKNRFLITHSKLRSQAITSHLKNHSPSITKQDIRNLLTTTHPHGLCNHYYNDGFGTLWSAIYDPTAIALDACFGAPTHNEYRRFDLDSPAGIQEYTAIAPITSEKWPM